MVNINCSENCIHSISGKCCLNVVDKFSNYIGYNSDCAYFTPHSSPNQKK
ncbi:MAG: hydroxymyristoyl-ACP dehydratase [Clostridium sp.]